MKEQKKVKEIGWWGGWWIDDVVGKVKEEKYKKKKKGKRKGKVAESTGNKTKGDNDFFLFLIS